MKRFLKRTGWVCLSLFLLLNIIAAFHAWKFTHFYDENGRRNKQPEQMTTREKLGIIFFGVRIAKSVTTQSPAVPFEIVHLRTQNGLQLEGWWIPVKNSRGTVILFHGYNGNKGSLFPEADRFRALGYNTFLLDFRAHGNSEGHTCSVGYKEAEDVKLAWDYVHQKTTQPIILWGVSMGAAAILKAVPEYGLHPQKIILQCPFATLTDAVKSRMRAVHLPVTPLSQLLAFWGGVEQGFWGAGFKPESYAKDIKVPVLYFYGQQDIRVMPAETQAVFSNLDTRQKTLHIFPNAGHQSFCGKDAAVWMKEVTTFLQ
ncbi:MAG: alpha/beta fold hydrolase [Chitinophaga sp.]|uniref:alpha/beta hydrolase n=1 Tax=Chitinophaga sp. TaxID=1869181 RepID=UPI001B0356CD|nr:alpha/beta fold hydrolase [Chitinophaga sp.]MBO9731886.1 alpha/beta fold hydrolase [Chitinophaga sp.]